MKVAVPLAKNVLATMAQLIFWYTFSNFKGFNARKYFIESKINVSLTICLEYNLMILLCVDFIVLLSYNTW